MTQILMLAWAVAFAGSFFVFYITPATDFGLTGGWNRVSSFLKWQSAATAFALLCAISSRRIAENYALRRLGLVPLSLFAFLLAAFLALVLWANLQGDAPVSASEPPRSLSQPIESNIPGN